jgi:hypothetical protein
MVPYETILYENILKSIIVLLTIFFNSRNIHDLKDEKVLKYFINKLLKKYVLQFKFNHGQK